MPPAVDRSDPMIEAANPVAGRELSRLVGALGLKEHAAGCAVRIVGDDFPQISPHRLATASAVAIAAHAVAVAGVWRFRGGKGQEIRVETARALQALRSYTYVQQNDAPVSEGPGKSGLRFHRTRDRRWIYITGDHQRGHFLDAALELLQVPNAHAAVAAAVAKWDGEALEDALTERKVPAALVRTEAEWREHPHGRWLAARPLVEIEKIADGPPMPLGEAERPLSGLRVLDMAHVICGPTVARFMAEQGADVLHVSRPYGADSNAVSWDTGWGKRHAVADLRRAGDDERLRALAGDCDMFVQSWRPGALDRHGFSPKDLSAIRPGIIYVSASCYGSGGPWGDRGGYDPNSQTATGLVHGESFEGPPRMARTVTVNDYLTAYLGAAGALAALLRRAREGGSYRVSVALAASGMWVQSLGLMPEAQEFAALPYGDPVEPHRIAMASAFGTLSGLAPAAEYSETPAYAARPPEPPGASPLQWLD